MRGMNADDGSTGDGAMFTSSLCLYTGETQIASITL